MKNNTLYELLKNTGYRGFHLAETHYIKELQCEAWLLTHSSGASLLYLDTEDKTKTFSLSFRLAPEDHTGVAHIIEHTMLSGSQKYKVKNWGGDGLLNSFYGAFTMRDSSMYPVSSKNEKSFQELVKVYTDCVFAPLALQSDKTMLQEGWHYEYDKETDRLSYSGIVYSEMQSAYQMPEFVLGTAQVRAALPKTSLYYDVGGDPAYITDLTYAHFLETYYKVFIPENCLAFVYGKTCLEEVLNTVDPYLTQAVSGKLPPRVQGSPALWNGKPYTECYPLPEDASAEKKSFIGCNWVISREPYELASAAILADILNQKLSSMLSEYNLEFVCQRDHYWPMLTLTVRNSNPDEIADFKEKVTSALETIKAQGLTEKVIQSAINTARFGADPQLAFLPAGVAYGIKFTVAWCHDQKPWAYIETEDYFQWLSEQNLPAYFSGLLQKLLLENELYSQFVLKAVPGLSEKRKEAEQKRLSEIRNALSEQEFAELLSRTEALHQYQQAPDHPEDVAALPRTEISDLEKDAPVRYVEEKQTPKGTVLFYPEEKNIINTTLHYSLPSLCAREYQQLGILTLLFGQSADRDDSLQAQISAYTNGLAMTPQYYTKDSADFVKLQIQFDCLPEYFSDAQQLVDKLIRGISHTTPEHLRTLLHQYVSAFTSAVPDTCGWAKSSCTPGGAAARNYQGFGLYQYAKQLLEDLPGRFEALSSELESLARTVLNPARLTVGISCRRSMFEDAAAKLIFRSVIPEDPDCDKVSTEICPLFSPKEALQISGTMQYTTLAFKVPAPTGALLAASKLAQNFAISSIRDIGGAYHAKVLLNTEGDLMFLISRDPHLAQTFANLRKLPEQICAADDAQVKDAVMTAAASFASPVTFSATGYETCGSYNHAARNYFTGFTPEKQQALWEDLLAVTTEDVHRCAEVFEKAVHTESYCSAASSVALEKDGYLFAARICL